MRNALALCLITLFLTAAAAAQTLEVSADLRLDDNTPRTARTVGLGSATDALGDVDMAANPATLMNATRTMFFVQGAYDSIGANRDFVRNNFPAAETIRVDGRALSYAAAAKPIGAAVFGVYYAAAPRQSGPDPLIQSFGTAPYQPATCSIPCGYYIPVQPEAFERTEHRYGVALAWKLGAFDFGAGAEMQRIAETGESARFVVGDLTLEAPPVVDPERLIVRAQSRDVVANVGVRWRATPSLALAASYTGGGSLSVQALACNAPDFVSPVCSSSSALIASARAPMPDTLRAGVTLAATDRLRLLGQAVHRGWGRQTALNVQGRNLYRDTVEVHAGAEYKVGAVALRAGWWRDPAHVPLSFSSLAISRDVTHRTIGAGIDVGRGARLDVAYDDADLPYQRRAVVGLAFGL